MYRANLILWIQLCFLITLSKKSPVIKNKPNKQSRIVVFLDLRLIYSDLTVKVSLEINKKKAMKKNKNKSINKQVKSINKQVNYLRIMIDLQKVIYLKMLNNSKKKRNLNRHLTYPLLNFLFRINHNQKINNQDLRLLFLVQVPI